jgi:PAB-dependent poly(A)-specific ribonuclease subunit 2
VPTFVCYVRRDLLPRLAAYDAVPPVPLAPTFLLTAPRTRPARPSPPSTCVPLSADEVAVVARAGALCAIDAEFVAQREEEMELRPDGSRTLLRPSRLALARVTVVRGDVRRPCADGIARARPHTQRGVGAGGSAMRGETGAPAGRSVH